MGCVVTKPSMNSPTRGLEKLKMDNGYVKGGGVVAARRSTGQRPPPLGKESGKTNKSDSTKSSSASGSSSGGREGKSTNGGSGRSDSDVENLARRFTTSGEDELVDGWPKWLTDNIPRDALAGLVPKSAESYDKIDKVSLLLS